MKIKQRSNRKKKAIQSYTTQSQPIEIHSFTYSKNEVWFVVISFHSSYGMVHEEALADASRSSFYVTVRYSASSKHLRDGE